MDLFPGTRAGSPRRPAVAMASALAMLSAGVAAADGPGMLLYTGRPAGLDVHRAPFRPYRAIGRAPQNAAQPVLPLIGEDGRVYVFAADDSPLRAVPASIVAPEQVVYTPLGFCMARGDSGSLWIWGSAVPAWMPGEPMAVIDAGRNSVGGVTMDGGIRVWNLTGPVEIDGKLSAARSLSLGVDWGATISVGGELQLFGFGSDGSTPPLQSGWPLADVSVEGTVAAARAVAIDVDGALRSLAGTLEAPGVYEQVSVAQARLVALQEDGVARGWNWSGAGWVPSQPLPGVFSDVAVSGTATFAILDPDASRDGVRDSVQILAGGVPDINGDMLDDRTQPSTVILDEDVNGVPDRTESPGTGERRVLQGALWFYSDPDPVAVCIVAAARVPIAGERLRRVTLRHVSEGSGEYALPVGGLEAEFAIWIDPSSDGNPEDAVLARAYPVLLSPTGRTEIDLDGVLPGPPGTVFFQSITYSQPSGRRYTIFPGNVPALPAGSVDSLKSARQRGRCWAMAWRAGDDPVTRTARMRDLQPFENWNHYSVVPLWTAVWDDLAPGDCDGDGVLDSLMVGPGSPVDLNNNGVVDSCEQDCDGDGQFDVTEILAGDPDCNLDMVPDTCEPTQFESSIDLVAPSANAPVEIAFPQVPPALGDVTVTVEATADLGAPTEFLVLEFPGLANTALFTTTGRDCPATNDSASRAVPAEIFNAARAGGEVRFTVSASSFVSAAECPTAAMRVSLSYAIGIEDCDGDGIEDSCQHGWMQDCNGDGVPDSCQLEHPAFDVDGNGVLDACEFDCDGDGLVDRLEIIANPTLDCDGTGFLDACEFLDCNLNGLHDPCELDQPGNDCNADGILDVCQDLLDCNDDGVPDACQQLPDCDGDGQPDACEVDGGAPDKDGDGVPDSCEYDLGDFDLDGAVGPSDLAFLLAVWGVTGLEVADLDGDGEIGSPDLAILLGNWGPTGL